MERNYKDDGSTTRMNRLEIKEVDYMRLKTTQAEVQPTMNISTHKSERQVLMQHMKNCPQMVYIMQKKNYNL